MKLHVNGAEREFAEVVTLEGVLQTLNSNDGRGVAVAVDGEVIPRIEWPTFRLTEGSSLEVVRAVQGG